MPIPHVLQYILGNAWAIQPEKLEAIVALVLRHDSGVKLSEEQIRSVVAAAPARMSSGGGGAVGVLPLYGSIFPRANMITENSGGTTLTSFKAGLRAFLADSTVKAVVIEADSPGGVIDGVPEMAAEIQASRGQGKPIVAMANTLMASAAYWIGAAADEVIVSPSGMAGSIGVYYPHEDVSGALAQEGRKVELVSAGEGKTDASEFGPLSDAGRAKIQKRVDEVYGMFVASVSKGRGVSKEKVRTGWKAGMYGAQEAVSLGLADRVATLEETLARLASGPGRSASLRGEAVSVRLEMLAAGKGWDDAAEVWVDPPAPAYDGEAERRLIRSRIAGL